MGDVGRMSLWGQFSHPVLHVPSSTGATAEDVASLSNECCWQGNLKCYPTFEVSGYSNRALSNVMLLATDRGSVRRFLAKAMVE